MDKFKCLTLILIFAAAVAATTAPEATAENAPMCHDLPQKQKALDNGKEALRNLPAPQADHSHPYSAVAGPQDLWGFGPILAVVPQVERYKTDGDARALIGNARIYEKNWNFVEAKKKQIHLHRIAEGDTCID